MANYYEILKVSPKASRTEIKSAYRRLARKLHPDKNHGSEETARAFAKIAEAWEVLQDPKARAIYDKRLLHAQMHHSGEGDSLEYLQNTRARKWRQMVLNHRFDEIIDRIVEEERQESLARQRFIFPMVALFVSTMAVAIIRPDFFLSDYFGKLLADPFVIPVRILIISLFIVGLIHLFRRFREWFARYTYSELELHESILEDTEAPVRQYSRYLVGFLIVLGIAACFGLGLTLGYLFQFRSFTSPYIFSSLPKIDMVVYPPIFVLLVDLMLGLVLGRETPTITLS